MGIGLLLLLTMAIPFPLCLFRMKKYGISLLKMIAIYLVFSTVGFIGARFGPMMVGMEAAGVRLYGLVLVDFFALFLMSLILKIDVFKLGDFIAPPIMAVCASSKIHCLINNCCKGIIMYYRGNKPIYFPSVIVEMTIWFILVVILLLVERKKSVVGILWPALMIWFGIARFFVDFLRGSERERQSYCLSLPGGQFWSLVILVAGAVFAIYTFQRIRKSRQSINNFN